MLLGLGETRSGSVGAVRKHDIDASFTYFGVPLKIDRLTIYRRIVNLKISGMEKRCGRRFNIEAYRVRNGMRRVDCIYSELP